MIWVSIRFLLKEVITDIVITVKESNHGCSLCLILVMQLRCSQCKSIQGTFFLWIYFNWILFTISRTDWQISATVNVLAGGDTVTAPALSIPGRTHNTKPLTPRLALPVSHSPSLTPRLSYWGHQDNLWLVSPSCQFKAVVTTGSQGSARQD